MDFTKNNLCTLFVILVIVFSVYYLKTYTRPAAVQEEFLVKTQALGSREGTGTFLSAFKKKFPTFTEGHSKITTGYLCNSAIDSTLGNFEQKFCNLYPGNKEVNRDRVTLIPQITSAGDMTTNYNTSKLKLDNSYRRDLHLSEHLRMGFTGKPYRVDNYTKEEALNVCKKDVLCDRVDIGNFHSSDRGKAWFYREDSKGVLKTNLRGFKRCFKNK